MVKEWSEAVAELLRGRVGCQMSPIKTRTSTPLGNVFAIPVHNNLTPGRSLSELS